MDAAKAASGVKLASQVGNGPRNAVLAGLLALVIGVVVWLARRGKAGVAAPTKDLAVPADPTPFSTVAFLRRIRSDHAPASIRNDKASLERADR